MHGALRRIRRTALAVATDPTVLWIFGLSALVGIYTPRVADVWRLLTGR